MEAGQASALLSLFVGCAGLPMSLFMTWFSTVYHDVDRGALLPSLCTRITMPFSGVKLLNTLLDEGRFAWPKKEGDTLKLLEIIMSFFVI